MNICRVPVEFYPKKVRPITVEFRDLLEFRACPLLLERWQRSSSADQERGNYDSQFGYGTLPVVYILDYPTEDAASSFERFSKIRKARRVVGQ